MIIVTDFFDASQINFSRYREIILVIIAYQRLNCALTTHDPQLTLVWSGEVIWLCLKIKAHLGS